MAVTSIDIDVERLATARSLAGVPSNRETVAIALDTLIAVRQQKAIVARIIAHPLADEQIDAPVIAYPVAA